MDTGIVGQALEREHREIDAGIAAFSSGREDPTDRAASLVRAIDALRRHIYLEEEFLFPPMRSELAIPMSVMLREHGEIWTTLDELERQLDESGPTDSMIETCRALMSQLDAHNSKEEPIFYTRADDALTPSDTSQLMAIIETGRMPEGWVCGAALEGERKVRA